MSAIDIFVEKSKALGKTIVLPEGQDARVVAAANRAMEDGIVGKVVVLGSEAEIAAACKDAGITERKFEQIDYLNAPEMEAYTQQLFEKRRAKDKPGKETTIDQIVKMMQSRIYYGAMMTSNGAADGLVAGSIAATADMLRAAFHCIGTAPGMKIASSCFVMDLVKPAPAGDNVLLFGDCGVNPNPNADQLVDIAAATANTYRSLMGKTPKVAFLSFSSYGSAQNEILDKIIEASAKFKEKIKAENLDIITDGELQADAAIVPSVAKAKAPQSPLEGAANVLIFPDLNAGNICYKLVQRLAGAGAYGPILQGLAKPLNDLSRGCSADDIYGVMAITSCQANK